MFSWNPCFLNSLLSNRRHYAQSSYCRFRETLVFYTLRHRIGVTMPNFQTHLFAKASFLNSSLSNRRHCPQCEKGCKEYKPKSEFARWRSSNIAKRCLGCEYPKCYHCGHQHPRTATPVYEHHKIGGRWYCGRNPECKKAAAAARKTATVAK